MDNAEYVLCLTGRVAGNWVVNVTLYYIIFVRCKNIVRTLRSI